MPNPTIHVPLTIERLQASAERLEVPVSISSEVRLEQEVPVDGYPVLRRVKLSHSADAVDLSEAVAKGIPVREMHVRGLPLARVVDPSIDANRVLRGIMRFSRSDAGRARWQDMVDGILTDLSVGAEVIDYQDLGDELDVTRWRPAEVSIVDVGMDPSVGAFRSKPNPKPEDKAMADVDAGPTTEQKDGPEAVVSTLSREYKVIELQARRKAAVEERGRISDIDAIFDLPSLPRDERMRAIRIRAIEKGWSADATRKAVHEIVFSGDIPDLGLVTDEDLAPHYTPPRDEVPAIARTQTQARGIERRPLQRAQAGQDERKKLAGIIEKTLLVRANLDPGAEVVREVRASGMHDFSAMDLGIELLRSSNIDIRGRSKLDRAGILLTRAGSHSDADFPSILANVATKAATRGWMEANTTWQLWANVGSLGDFKVATIAGLGGFPDLDLIPRSGGPYNEHSMDDVHEYAQLSTYGALFSIGRQTLVNDDLGMLMATPRKMGAAAGRKVNGLAYAILTSNPTLNQDSTSLFDVSDHANYVSGSGAAPSTTTLDTAFTAMATQKSPARAGETQSDYLNIRPSYLIVPMALDTTARVLMSSTYDPAGTTASISKRDAPNPFQGRCEVVSDALLDAASTTAWYLAAARNSMVDTVTVFFLNGQQEPFLEELPSNNNHDGLQWKVRIDAVAAALDYRGLYCNVGT